MKIALPYPPSINRYWRRVGSRTLISREGRAFRRNVCALLAPRPRSGQAGGGPRKPPAGGRIAGPAIVQQIDATTLIEPGAAALVDEIGNLRIAVGLPA